MENLNLKIFNPNPRSKQKRFNSTANKDRKCHFCDNPNGIYVCPKCDSPYCSINCFRSQKHLQCSETFYKKMVFQQLKHVKTDQEEKNRFLEMLKQNASSSDNPSGYMDMISYLDREDDDDDEQEELDLDLIPNEMMQNFLEKMDSIFEENPEVNADSIWNELSHQDRNEFIRICNENETVFKRLIPVWTPWWLCSEWQTVVEEVDSSPVQSKKLSRYPKIYEEIEPLSKLTQKTPDPSLATSIMSVCFAYCYLCRHNNGEICSCAHLVDEDQSTHCCDRWMPSIVDALFHLVPSLRPPSTLDEMIHSNLTLLESLETLTQRWLMLNDDDEPNIELDPLANIAERKSALQKLFQDLRIVMEWEQKPGRQLLIQSNPESRKYLAPKAIILILSDLIHILERIEQCLRQQKTKVTNDTIVNVKMAKQKLKFYLSYTIEYGQERFGGSKQKGFLAAIDFHLEKLRQETIDQQTQNV